MNKKMTNKEIKKKINKAFYNYRKNKKRLENDNLSDNERYEILLWTVVVDKTMEHFHSEKQRLNLDYLTLIELYFFKRKSEVFICRELYAHRRSIYRWLEPIQYYAAILAAQMELITL